MSKRRGAGNWVRLMPNSGFAGESNRLRAEIQPEDDPPQMLDEPFREAATCECDGCPWCGSGCDMDAAALRGGQHLCAGCADIENDD